MDILQVVGSYAQALNSGRAPIAIAEGEWLKLVYGGGENWIRTRRIGPTIHEVQVPVRLTGIIGKHVSFTFIGGLASTTVRDRDGYKLPVPEAVAAPLPEVAAVEAGIIAEPPQDVVPSSADGLTEMTVAELDDMAESVGHQWSAPRMSKAAKIAELRTVLE